MIKSILLFLALIFFTISNNLLANNIISYITKPQNIKLFHATKDGKIFGNFKNLKSYLKEQNKTLIFAMNGGMYMKDFFPQGLYIEDGKVIKDINRVKNAYGNFYMQPNGVFLITNKKAYVKTADSLKSFKDIKYATQSGPMLVVNGKINSKFNPNSTSYYIRNGVGILPNGDTIFAISKEPIRFYDFAKFFKDKGCKNALYLDGYVSRIYLPKKGIKDQDGVFGIIIAEVK